MLEARTHPSRLVDAIETGVEQEVVIARNGRPVARLTSLSSASPPRRLGVARGAIVAPDWIDAANSRIEALFDEASSVLFSHVSIWAIAIKHAIARSAMPISAAQAIPWSQECGFAFLPLDLPDLLTLEQLPQHHRDPFDRLLRAQSLCESLTLVSAERAVLAYGCPLQDARP